MTAAPSITILQAMRSRQIWAGWFARSPGSWEPWRIFLKALFGLALEEGEMDLFRACSGLAEPPAGGVFESWLICGRRSGKSFILALIAVFLACFRDWRPFLSPGEAGTVKIIAVDRRQARTIYKYCKALIGGVPVLAALIERESDDEIVLNNGVTLEIQAASFRSTRGYTLIAGLVDELAFMRSDEGAANLDEDILGALRPAMATVPGSMLFCASSPYARRGAL